MSASREPGYVLFFLAPVYYFFENGVFVAQLFQIIISLVTIVLIYLLAKRYFSDKAALLAAFLYAIFPSAIYYTGEILTETLFTFLWLLSIFIFLLGLDKKDNKRLFISGLLFGMTALVRFFAVFFPIFLLPVIYVSVRSWKKTFALGSLVIIGSLLLIVPWVVKVSMEYDHFIFGRLGGGHIYWSGSLISSDGEWVTYTDPRYIEAVDGEKDPIKREEKLIDLTIKNIKEHPLKVALIWLKKPAKIFLIKDAYGLPTGRLLVSECLINNNQQIFRACVFFGITNIIYWILLAGALSALIVLFNKKRILFTLFLVLFLYAFIFVMPVNSVTRYRYPFLPYIFILGSYFLLRYEKKWLLFVRNISEKIIKIINLFFLKN